MDSFPLVKVLDIKLEKKQTNKSYIIEGFVKYKTPFCHSCQPKLVQDSVYVPKNFHQ
jgi:hypothetical protein